MIKTQICWNYSSFDQDAFQIKEKAHKKAQEYFNLNKLTTVEVLKINTPAGVCFVRQWEDLETAQEWIDFISQFSPNSAVIITE